MKTWNTIFLLAATLLGYLQGQSQAPAQVKDLLHNYSNSSYVPYTRIGNKVYYEVNYGELWVTDGTTAGTIQLKNFASDEISTFHELNGKLMFFADGDNNSTSELWTSDGTIGGTVMVKNMLQDWTWSTGYSEVPYAKVGSKYFYEINYGELWVTDGTAAGSLLLKDWPSLEISTFHELNGKLLLFADGDNNAKSELWTSDGTVGGTVMVKNMLHDWTWSTGYSLVPYAKVGSKYFYEINYGELWVTDGTSGGSLQLKNWASKEMSTFHELNGKLFLFADGDNNATSELWSSDGTVAGTVMVKNMLHDWTWSTGYSLVPYAKVGSKYFYEINYGELWVTDGTSGGSIQLKNWASKEMSTFHELNGKLLLFADGDNNALSELWSSDGTVAGTVMVKNMLHDWTWSTGYSFVPYAKVGNKYFYEINYGELWVTDGSAGGSLQLKNWASKEMSTFHELNGKLMLMADGDNNATSELWSSDGTVGGTTMVKNMLHDWTWSTGYSFVPYQIGNGKVFYDINFGELWVSDGTSGGSIMLKNFTSDQMGQFHTLNDDLLLFGDDNSNGSYELWSVQNAVVGLIPNPTATQDLILWPVPAHNMLNLETHSAEFAEGEVEILDLQGKTVRTGTLVQQQAQIHVEDLPAGIYLARVATESGTLVQKFMVQ